MIQNKLILRDTPSTFTGEYADITQGSVLSWAQMDGNFIHLKGHIITTGETTSNSIILRKLNGEDITIPANFSGGSGSGSTPNIDAVLGVGFEAVNKNLFLRSSGATDMKYIGVGQGSSTAFGGWAPSGQTALMSSNASLSQIGVGKIDLTNFDVSLLSLQADGNKNSLNYTALSTGGTKNINVTFSAITGSKDINFNLPNKVSGTYTLATLDDISGGGLDQDNKFNLRYMILHQQDGSVQEVVDLINNFPTFVVGDTELPILYIFHLTTQGVFVYKYIMVNNHGKGTYGSGGTQLTINDVELLSASQISSIGIGDLENTEIINYGDITGMTISDWLNAESPTIDIQPLTSGFTLFQGTVDGITVDYLWIGVSGSYGFGGDQSTMDDFQVVDSDSTNGLQNLRSVLTVGNYVELFSYSHLYKLRTSNSLIPFQPYKVPNVDTNLYGGTEIIIQAVNSNTLHEKAIGKFYNPFYDQSIPGYGIWSPDNSYSIGDIAHWGGMSWTNVNGNVGSASDRFNLDGEWEVIPFDDVNYRVTYDDIRYDVDEDLILERKEGTTNVVSSSVDYAYRTFYNNGFTPIKVFQWGNESVTDNDFGTVKGIGHQNIINSINDNLNFRGAYQIGLNFSDDSSQGGLDFSTDSYQRNITLANGSGQYDLIFLGTSFQENIKLDGVCYQQSIYLNNSSQTDFNFRNSSSQYNITLDSCYQLLFDFNMGGQDSLTESSKVQQNITINNFIRSTALTGNENGVVFQGSLTNDNTSTKLIGIKDNQLVQVDNAFGSIVSFPEAPINNKVYGRRNAAWFEVSGGTAPTGLEKITQGTTPAKSGWRFIGQNPTNFGNIGVNAVDLSSSSSSGNGALGDYSIAAGQNTKAVTIASVAMGTGSISNSIGAVAMGANCTAGTAINNGYGSVAMGFGNTTIGEGSTALGTYSTTNGQYSQALGLNCVTQARAEVVMGGTPELLSGDTNNHVLTNTAFRIGIGTDSAGTPVIRRDGFRLYKSGAMYLFPTELSAATNGLKGMFAYLGSTDRLNIHNGTAWQQVAYLTDITGGTSSSGVTYSEVAADFVPYTGATKNVDLGIRKLTVQGIEVQSRASNSTAVGSGAGSSGATSHTVFGHSAGGGASNDNQTAIGRFAGNTNSGFAQTVLGGSAGAQNTGGHTTGIGYAATFQNTGNYVNGLGYNAAQQNTGHRVNVMGYQAGLFNTGHSVIGIGQDALHSNSFSNIIVFRAFSGLSDTVATQDNQIVISTNGSNIRLNTNLSASTEMYFPIVSGATIATSEDFNRQITITGNTTISNTHNNAIIKVKGNATITVPSTLMANFNCVFRTFAGFTATFSAGGGVTFDAPSGTTLNAQKMATLFKDGSTATYILEGDLV